jgi:hypothetical protein
MQLATSTGEPIRLIGVRAITGSSSRSIISGGNTPPRLVSMTAGQTQFTRIDSDAISIASALVIPRTACLDVMYYDSSALAHSCDV